MYWKELKQAPRCHYLLVWDGYFNILNCSQQVEKGDEVLALMTKEQYHEFEMMLFKRPNSLSETLSNISIFWKHKKDNNIFNEPLSCDYECYGDYMIAWSNYEEERRKEMEKIFPEDDFDRLFKMNINDKNL